MRIAITFLLLALVVVARVVVGQYLHIYDDAFITYRYARNWATGLGLVFNPGERVWRFTSPAQTLLLAGFTLAGMETSQAGQLCGVLFITLSAFLIFRLAGAWIHPLFGALLALHHLALPIGSQFIPQAIQGDGIGMHRGAQQPGVLCRVRGGLPRHRGSGHPAHPRLTAGMRNGRSRGRQAALGGRLPVTLERQCTVCVPQIKRTEAMP